ncbi:MAG: AraC family ligand binding domain-containing protein [Spirochaetaceae bacterium]|jgi:hypothetical protein|nr:AraC family ligand binding domain-containing protein [Spirochaetaceae bacterium]
MKLQTDKNSESFMRYITYGREDEKLGMICTNAGFTRVKPYAIYPPNINAHPAAFRKIAEGRILPEFQIAYIARGEGTFEAEDTTYKVVPGSVLIMFPGQRHRAKPVIEEGWDEYWVGFNGPFFTSMTQEGILCRDHVFFETGLRNHILSIMMQYTRRLPRNTPSISLKHVRQYCLLLLKFLAVADRWFNPIITESSWKKPNT